MRKMEYGISITYNPSKEVSIVFMCFSLTKSSSVTVFYLFIHWRFLCIKCNPHVFKIKGIIRNLISKYIWPGIGILLP